MIFRHGRHKPSLSLSELEKANSPSASSSIPGPAQKDAKRRRHTQVATMRAQLCSHLVDKVITVICCFSLFGSLYRYHGNSDEVGCFVAARPLPRRNRYYEVRDHFFSIHDCSFEPAAIIQYPDFICSSASLTGILSVGCVDAALAVRAYTQLSLVVMMDTSCPIPQKCRSPLEMPKRISD